MVRILLMTKLEWLLLKQGKVKWQPIYQLRQVLYLFLKILWHLANGERKLQHLNLHQQHFLPITTYHYVTQMLLYLYLNLQSSNHNLFHHSHRNNS